MSTISWIVRRLPLRTIVLLDLVGLIGTKPSCCCAAATPTLNVDAPTSIRPISKQTRSPLEQRMALLLPLADDGSPRWPASARAAGPKRRGQAELPPTEGRTARRPTSPTGRLYSGRARSTWDLRR